MRSRYGIKNRSFEVCGRKSSVHMEEDFWASLREICKANGTTIREEIAKIDRTRTTGRASAIRVFVLNYYKGKANERDRRLSNDCPASPGPDRDPPALEP